MSRRERRAAKAQARGDGAPSLGAAASQAFSAGVWEQQAGLFPQAAGSFRKALALSPRHPDVHNNLGLVLQAMGDWDAAIAAFRRAVALKPNFPEALNNLANALRHQESGDEAVALYRKAIALAPDFAGTYNNFGTMLQSLGRFDEAIGSYERAIALQPDFAEAHNNLGSALQSASRMDEAIASFRRAIARKADYADAFTNLGSALHDLGRLDEALAAYRQAAALKTSHVIHNNLGMLQQDLGKPKEAIVAFRRALQLRPNFADALNNLVRARKLACDWPGLDTEIERCRAAIRAGSQSISPFAMLWLPTTPAEQLQGARGWTAMRTKGIAALPPPTAAPRERLRLAYLSADFREHPVAHLSVEMLERHDRSAFALTAYSAGPDDGSALRQRLVSAFDRFVEIGDLPPRAAASRIRDDGIDVLVDLTGHTRGGRLPILAARPAPIQVNFLGFPGTMGAPFVDYVIADPIALPLREQPFFDERIVHLPDCCLPADTARAIGEPPPRGECGLPEHGFVFGCFNNSYKLTPEFLDIWARLVRAVPVSVLWLAESNAMVRENLVREAAARGIAAERLVFAPRLPSLDAHLARLRHADLFLDTLPFNAHSTASDALRSGVPVLTCAGETFAGRIASSLVTAAGLPELATRTLAEYEALALRLATEPALLAELRGRLAANTASAPLFDMARFTRNIEAAYRRMWQRHLAGEPPEPFAVAP